MARGILAAASAALAVALAALPSAAAAQTGGPPGQGAEAAPDPLSEARRLAESGKAVLSRGAIPLRGLPFFAANAIPALYGEYVLPAGTASGATVPVWFTAETVVFGDDWRRSTAGGLAALVKQGPGGSVLALPQARYTLFLALPADTQALRAFAALFARRFSFFYGASRDGAEISFPAYLDLGG